MENPGYLNLSQEELKHRRHILLEGLKNCNICPRHCKVDRTANQVGDCRTGRQTSVASAQLHFGEEPEISGRNGSGTIFFTNCNLHCQFCQNHNISQESYGNTVSPEELAAMPLSVNRTIQLISIEAFSEQPPSQAVVLFFALIIEIFQESTK